jgi:uncharacterized OsmC-like protein
MTGTLAGALEARKIPSENNLVANVEAKIRSEGKMFLIDSVHIGYQVTIPGGRRAEADRALASHEKYCPVHESIKRGFPITWSAEIKEG